VGRLRFERPEVFGLEARNASVLEAAQQEFASSRDYFFSTGGIRKDPCNFDCTRHTGKNNGACAFPVGFRSGWHMNALVALGHGDNSGPFWFGSYPPGSMPEMQRGLVSETWEPELWILRKRSYFSGVLGSHWLARSDLKSGAMKTFSPPQWFGWGILWHRCSS
jgi:hypothetical protein